MNYPLMQENITRADLNKVIRFLQKKNPILTQSINVKKFEEEWSKWLGVKYSVFVNSGSSANLISIKIIKELFGLGEIIVPTLTWVSDIASVIQNGFQPVFVDIDKKNLCMNTEEVVNKITKKTKCVFLTHAQGFNGLDFKLLKYLKNKNIPLIEDVCESHGATYKNKKLGSYGLISNFSFYYAHHMSTIEGGMICTNNKKIYEIARMLRSHGMIRESNSKIIKSQYTNKYNRLNPDFIFAYPAYNSRNTEIGAIIGRNQLKKLDENNKKRISNFDFFIKNLNPKIYRVEFDFEGSCNYAFCLILKKKNFIQRDFLEQKMKLNGIEFRRGSSGGGNQLRQPYIKKYIKKIKLSDFPEVEHVHHFGYYIGNYPTLKKDNIKKICDILNSI